VLMLWLAKPCRADSPDSPTRAMASFWEKCDSPRHIRASNARVSRIWREWPLLNLKSLPVCNHEKLAIVSQEKTFPKVIFELQMKKF
jgi:hypothetical protein